MQQKLCNFLYLNLSIIIITLQCNTQTYCHINMNLNEPGLKSGIPSTDSKCKTSKAFTNTKETFLNYLNVEIHILLIYPKTSLSHSSQEHHNCQRKQKVTHSRYSKLLIRKYE